MNDAPDEFEQRTRAALRDSAEDLDGAMRSKLSQARHAALVAGQKPFWLDMRTLAPAGAVAVAVLATVVVLNRDGSPTLNAQGSGAFYDMELLADSDALDLSQEDDYEFIEWAAAMREEEPAGT